MLKPLVIRLCIPAGFALHLPQSARFKLLCTPEERILRRIVATDEAAMPTHCNEDEPQGTQNTPSGAGLSYFGLVTGKQNYQGIF